MAQALLAAIIAASLVFMALEAVSWLFHHLTHRPQTRNTLIGIGLLALFAAIYAYLNYLGR